MKYLLIISFLFIGFNLNAQTVRQAPTAKKQAVKQTKVQDLNAVKKDHAKLQAKYNLMKEILTDKTYLSNLNEKEKSYLMKNLDDVLDKIDYKNGGHKRRKSEKNIKKMCNIW